MRASTKRIASFIISLLLVTSAVIIYALFIVPAYSDIQKARGNLVSETQAYNDQKAIFDKINSLNDKYKGNGTLQDAVSLALPNEPFISQVLADVNGLAILNNHMSILSAQTEIMPLKADISWPSYIKNIGTVKLTLQIRGNYGDFKQFLSQLENNYRITDVKQINIKSDAAVGQAQNAALTYGLTVYAYYQDTAKAKAPTKK